jgi:hypothetical protein
MLWCTIVISRNYLEIHFLKFKDKISRYITKTKFVFLETDRILFLTQGKNYEICNISKHITYVSLNSL